MAGSGSVNAGANALPTAKLGGKTSLVTFGACPENSNPPWL